MPDSWRLVQDIRQGAQTYGPSTAMWSLPKQHDLRDRKASRPETADSRLGILQMGPDLSYLSNALSFGRHRICIGALRVLY